MSTFTDEGEVSKPWKMTFTQFVKASDSPNYESEELVNKALDIYRSNPKFEMVTVDGSHHVHLNNPERVAPRISQFFGKNFD